MVLILLAALQYLAATVSSRWPRGRTVLTARPTVLVDHGTVSEAALAQQRVSPAEVRQAIRASGAGDISRVAAVVLETDGSMSVIGREQFGDGSALQDVARPGEHPPSRGSADGER
ncbi:MAG: YetF domain-containing protein [Rhodococcus sp. (in: high G+C Gram-positive bacteria)]|uniref:YetF domain-containing protein n=1 Tax=Rhodococcus sp. TaxID=1831 RepID=UPI003BB0A759